ncbi:MAG: sugar ABC transporter permease [Halofilum sp. (in: g-proteobacteria)]|nr:sugar ABC transporter permease [Halofilum sp. (in: g-proteobacteria)]
MTTRDTAAGSAAPPGWGRRLELLADRKFRYLLIVPTVFLLLSVTVFPAIYTLIVSFQDITLMAEDRSFHGLMNYQRLLEDSRFWWSLVHTVGFLLAALALQFVLGLLMALLFVEWMPGRQVFITLLVLPTVISPIVAGSAWRIMYEHQYGPISQIIGWLAELDNPVLWTADPTFVYPAILLAEVWQWTPFMFLLLLAALVNVDKSQVESAEIDGSTYWRTFWYIVFPAIRPVVAVALLIRSLDLFRVFDKVWILTQGGPGTMTELISIYIYKVGFQQFQTSYAAAMTFVVIILLTAVVVLALRRMGVSP